MYQEEDPIQIPMFKDGKWNDEEKGFPKSPFLKNTSYVDQKIFSSCISWC
jgi:hypothetical protein